DGIRDKLVTGVQTCALPISPIDCRRRKSGKSGSRVPGDLCGRIRHDVCMRMTTETHIYGEWPSPIDGADVARKQVGLAFPVIDRSEERRVGKECRWLWARSA